MMWAGSHPEDWATRVERMVDEYLPEGLKDIAAQRAVTREDLEKVVKKPVVHGDLLRHNLGVDKASRYMDSFMRGSMKWLA